MWLPGAVKRGGWYRLGLEMEREVSRGAGEVEGDEGSAFLPSLAVSKACKLASGAGREFVTVSNLDRE